MTSLLYANDQKGQYPDSWYAATADFLKAFPALEGEVECDICVIGGGYSGLSTALHLAEKGYDVVLLDAHRVGWGASGRNGGQVGSGQRREQDDLEGMFGMDRARALWDMGEASKKLVKDLITRYDIDCDFKHGILHADHKESYVSHSHKMVEKLRRDYGYDHIEALSQTDISDMLGTDVFYGGSLDRDSGHLHPLNYALGLARACEKLGVRIFEQTEVTDWHGGENPLTLTEKGRVKSRFLFFGCNGYLGKLAPKVASRVMPINNFIIATEPLGEARARRLNRDDVAVGDSRFVINYFRMSRDNRLLWGGGESYGYRFPGDIKDYVRRVMLRIYPELSDVKIDYGWGGTLALTMNRLPHMREIEPHIFTATGYSGHGVAMATLCGSLVAEMIDGKASRYDIMASIPNARFPGGALLRWPLLVTGMLWHAMRDRL